MSRSPWKSLVGGVALTALLAAAGGGAETGKVPGVSSMKDALELSARTKRPIVVDFSTDW